MWSSTAAPAERDALLLEEWLGGRGRLNGVEEAYTTGAELGSPGWAAACDGRRLLGSLRLAGRPLT